MNLVALLLAAGLAYPPAPRGNAIDDYAGKKLESPYRWMEESESPQVESWVEAENRITYDYLSRLPRRDEIRKNLTALLDYARTEVPEREAGRLYYQRNSGLQKQAVIYRDQSPVLDPNQLFPDGSFAVGQWKVSPDGRWLAYTTAAGGSDLRDIHLRDLKSGTDAKDVVPRVKFSGISWSKDSRGFYYERYKGTEQAVQFSGANTFHQVFFHRAGSMQDQLVFERPNDPHDGVGAEVSDDGRWLFLTSASGTSNNRLWISAISPVKPLVVAGEQDAIVHPLGVAGRTLYVRTTYGAPNGRIVAVNIGDADRAHWKTIVAETKDPIRDALLIKDRLVVLRLVDVQSRIDLTDLSGKPVGEVKLPEAGSAQNLTAKNGDPDFWLSFSSFLRPATVYRYDVAHDSLTPFLPPQPKFDASKYETRATFYLSKDGAKVPLFITARKGVQLDGNNPAILYGYGGFNVALQPAFSNSIVEWLELGGVYAQANLRGGSEYGEAWHHAGMREKKQTVFDDFIAAAEYLEQQGWTSPQRLAIKGGSNGGLLIGAVANQRPDLFAVALPAVGVMDMLRYQKFTGGAWWVDEYGSSDDASMLPTLLAYSPVHNVKPGCHPATLVTTADRDDRVVPSHSFKYAAALQAAQTCDNPVLIRVEVAGSHGYRPTDRIIEEIADQYAFALANLSLPVPAPVSR